MNFRLKSYQPQELKFEDFILKLCQYPVKLGFRNWVSQESFLIHFDWLRALLFIHYQKEDVALKLNLILEVEVKELIKSFADCSFANPFTNPFNCSSNYSFKAYFIELVKVGKITKVVVIIVGILEILNGSFEVMICLKTSTDCFIGTKLANPEHSDSSFIDY